MIVPANVSNTFAMVYVPEYPNAGTALLVSSLRILSAGDDADTRHEKHQPHIEEKDDVLGD